MKQQIAHIKALTGLRFVAALLVFIHHASNLKAMGVPNVRFSLGAVGVSFFYVLSGFIMCYVYGDRLEKKDVLKYLVTRVARIWPLHLCCLLIFLVMFESWDTLVNTPHETTKLAVNALLLQSWTASEDWVISFNGPSWSLSTEMAFYFFFPLFILIGKRRFPAVYIALGVFTILAIGGLDWCNANKVLPTWVDVANLPQAFPLLRLFEFATGIATAYLFSARKQTEEAPHSFVRDTLFEVLSLSLVIGFLVLAQKAKLMQVLIQLSGPAAGNYFRFSGTVFVFAVVIFVFAQSRGMFGRFFSLRPIFYLGEISFSFYLVHRMVIRWMVKKVWLADYFPHGTVLIVVFLLCVGFSALLFTFVEIPCKQAILAFYEQSGSILSRFGKCLHAYWVSARKFASTNMFRVSVVIMALLIGMIIWMGNKETQFEDTWRVISRSDAEYRDVDFGEQATLKGLALKANKINLTLEMIWQPKKADSQDLSIVLYNEQGDLIEPKSPVQHVELDRGFKQFWFEERKYPLPKIKRGSYFEIKFTGDDSTTESETLRVAVPAKFIKAE